MTDSKYAELKNFVLNTNHTNNCVEWWGQVNAGGYGRVWHKNKYQTVTRLVLNLYLEQDKPDLIVLHSCDNRKCINPNHLSYGTHKENNLQCRDRLRNKAHKLDWTKVNYIREQVKTNQRSQRQLAWEFQVSVNTISKIITQKTWVTQ